LGEVGRGGRGWFAPRTNTTIPHSFYNLNVISNGEAVRNL
jgi:hypothetical protein